MLLCHLCICVRFRRVLESPSKTVLSHWSSHRVTPIRTLRTQPTLVAEQVTACFLLIDELQPVRPKFSLFFLSFPFFFLSFFFFCLSHIPSTCHTCTTLAFSLYTRLDIDSDNSHAHPSCVAQPICRCQEQSCAQNTVQIHGNHGGRALLSPFLILVYGALATERVCCLPSGDRD